MQDYKNLQIYGRSIEYCAEIYKFSALLPDHEKYGLVSQIRRAACSIPLNISEGAGTTSRKEFAQFISYAYRSVNEVLTCFDLVERLDLHKSNVLQDKLRTQGTELSRMIYSFFKSLGGRTFYS